MKFTKMHGTGNDYVYVNLFEETISDISDAAIRVSDRHFGIGSDGLIAIAPSDVADCRMIMYNADGTEGAMCGNGIRCVAKYAYDHDIAKKEHMTIETKSGIKTIDLTVENGKAAYAKVNMGKAILDPKKIPVKAEGDSFISQEIMVGDKPYTVTCVSMGNPNCVVMMEEISKNKALHLGPYVENSKYFPNRINMQLCHVVDRENIQIEIYERGAGYTYASGTGACAAASAAHKLGLVGNRVQVHMQGGDLLVEFAEDDRVFMTGPVVYIGSITLAENFFA